MSQHRYQRIVVWLLASLSFACLIGQFYDFWSMQLFACWIFIPASLALAMIAWRSRLQSPSPRSAYVWIVHGTIAGVVAAMAYDLFRLPFVLAGYPLFAVFPRFGQLLTGASSTDFGPLVQITGWLYHFSNAAALGIMFLAMVSGWRRLTLIGGATVWAGAVEIFLLLTPYYAYFKLKLPYSEFLALTISAHLVFGLVLGLWCWYVLGRKWQAAGVAVTR